MAESIVNRGDPVPVISVNSFTADREPQDVVDTTPGQDGKRARAKRFLASALTPSSPPPKAGDDDPSPGLQDRLFSKLMQSVVPQEDLSDDDVHLQDPRSTKSIERPNFSLPLMTKNFRRFNGRIGVAFVFQAHIIRLLSWKSPTQTLSLLALYTLICLDPPLLFVVPLASVVLFVMIPAFVARHPAPPTALPTEPYPAYGPPTAPPRDIKPVTDLSKDFFRNMRDLQNCMEDFSVVHDQVITTLAPWTNFSNEPLSTTLFMVLFLLTCVLFIMSRFLPYRAVFLVVGWAVLTQGHPRVQSFYRSSDQKPLFARQYANAQVSLNHWIDSDIILDDALESREVEIFEIQKRQNRGSGRGPDDVSEWETWIFSPSPYDPLSAARIAGNFIPGTRFFEDVEPPTGWQWGDKKWTLDLLSREWVEERMITGVEIETAGERWVYDISYEEGDQQEDSDEKSRLKQRIMGRSRDWEEGNGMGEVGVWRRRRWVRTVKRRQKQKSDN